MALFVLTILVAGPLLPSPPPAFFDAPPDT
jgi:hypothetical protein